MIFEAKPLNFDGLFRYFITPSPEDFDLLIKSTKHNWDWFKEELSFETDKSFLIRVCSKNTDIMTFFGVSNGVLHWLFNWCKIGDDYMLNGPGTTNQKVDREHIDIIMSAAEQAFCTYDT